MSSDTFSVNRSTIISLQEYARGIAGGLLFSLPLIYTMEMWQFGFSIAPAKLLLGVLGAFGLLLGYNRYAGLRRDASFTEVIIDSVEELGLGIVIAALTLWLLGQIDNDMRAEEIIGKIVVESMTVAIGVSVGTAQLGGGGGDTGVAGDPEAAPDHGANGQNQGARPLGVAGDAIDKAHFSSQIVIALCGAVLFAANVAPTEEIIIIAFDTSIERLLGLALLSIALGALILFFSDFAGSKRFRVNHGYWSILVASIITYATALAASAIILWFFGRFDGLAPATCVAATVVLGVAATLGASAGRLLLQSSSN